MEANTICCSQSRWPNAAQLTPSGASGAQRQQMLDVLFDKLLHVYKHEHAQPRVSRQQVTHKPGDQQRLASGRGSGEERIAPAAQ